MRWSGCCLGLVLGLACHCSIRSGSGIAVVEIPYPAELQVVRRADWGWQPLRASTAGHRVTRVTIHHSGEDFTPDREPAQYLRSLQNWSRSEKHWIDVPYHFFIDLEGRIYEGRPINYPGDTNTDYDPRGHGLICVLGNYEHQELTEAQFHALVALTAHLVRIYEVPLANIKGHRDYTDQTVCPGKNLYRHLEDGNLLRAVEDQLKR
ncbi:MAG: peptidoglycan recognition protein family protein [candidate division KSB1 bacterium]|nr:peptidoglycan recognition protein family protein [candidate division KSB1 bacterium]